VRPDRPITIRDLLTHTSGLCGQVPEPLRNLYRDFDRPLSEVAAIGSQAPLDFQPGARWQYSNIGIATLGRLIEVLSDQPYEMFMAGRIFEPLGMKDSFLFLPADRHDRLASLYRLQDGVLKKVDADGFRKGATFSPCRSTVCTPPRPTWRLSTR
jgi:CubicO group peptidase (beta-lactamase class C family)